MTNSSPIRIRDKLAQELLDGRDMSTQNTKPCFVFLDGEYWGLYEFYEKYSDYYGPLSMEYMVNDNYWMWVATPMPWEYKGGM